MAQIPTTNISLQAIQVETTHSGTSNISLQAQSQNVGNTSHTSTISGYTSPGGGLTGSPFGMGEFGGFVNTLATTSHSSVSASASNQDGPIDANYTMRVIYTDASTIRVRVALDEPLHSTPSNLSTVFQITGAPSGYTVRRGTITDGVNGHSDSFTIIPSSSTNRIETTAKAIPTSGTELKFGQNINSGGGFDDGETTTNNDGTCSLIFEKSGGTTFTYSYSYSMEAQNEGAGGE